MKTRYEKLEIAAEEYAQPRRASNGYPTYICIVDAFLAGAKYQQDINKDEISQLLRDIKIITKEPITEESIQKEVDEYIKPLKGYVSNNRGSYSYGTGSSNTAKRAFKDGVNWAMSQLPNKVEIDWKDLWSKYKEFYMTGTSVVSWQGHIGIFKWIEEKIKEQQQ